MRGCVFGLETKENGINEGDLCQKVNQRKS